MSIEAMKLALADLEDANGMAYAEFSVENLYGETITALRQAIEQAEKSVATNDTSPKRVDKTQKQRHDTTPPQRQWVGLTHEEVNSWDLPDCPTVFEFAQFIEAKLKEKNT